MTGKRVGLSTAKQVLSDLERDCIRVVRMADVEEAVCNLFGIEAAHLKSAEAGPHGQPTPYVGDVPGAKTYPGGV